MQYLQRIIILQTIPISPNKSWLSTVRRDSEYTSGYSDKFVRGDFKISKLINCVIQKLNLN